MPNHSKPTKPQRQQPPDLFFQAAVIPRRILYKLIGKAGPDKLNGTEIAIYMLVQALNHPTKGCWASNKTLAGFLGISDRAVQYGLAKLLHLDCIRSSGSTCDRMLRPNTQIDDDNSRSRASLPVGPTHEAELRTKKKKYLNNNKSADADGDGSMFLPELSTPATAKLVPTGQDKDNADRLYQAVFAAGKVVNRRWSKLDWAKQFTLLRIGCAGADCSENLEWYCAHIGDQYVPQAWSAKSFRLKYPAIICAHERWLKKNPTVEITDHAKQVFGYIKRLNWPKGSAANLPAAIQLSLDNYRKFIRPIHLLSEGKGPFRLLSKGIIHRWGEARHVVQKHFENVWRGVKKWEAWSGDIFRYVWSPAEDSVRQIGLGLAVKWGKQNQWDELLKEIEK